MVDKWRDSLSRASDPHQPIYARIITRPARAEKSWLAERVLPLIERYGGALINDERWQVTPIADNDNGLRRRLTIHLPHRQQCNDLAKRLARLMIVNGSPKNGTATLRPTTQFTTDGLVIESMDRDDYTLQDFWNDVEKWECEQRAKMVAPPIGSYVRVHGVWKSDSTLVGLTTRIVQRKRLPIRHTPNRSGVINGTLMQVNDSSWIVDGVIVETNGMKIEMDHPLLKAVAICGFEPTKYDAGVRDITLPERWVRVWSEEREKDILVKAPVCPRCGKPLGTRQEGDRFILKASVAKINSEDGKKRKKKPERYRLLLNANEIGDTCPHADRQIVTGPDGKVMMMNGQPLMSINYCGHRHQHHGRWLNGTRLYEMSRWRRIGLSRLIQRKYPHRFKVYVADEIHKTKSGDTDLGTADGRLISSIRDSLALTGTIFGGNASSLFYLLYRRNPDVRKLYGYKEVNRWIDHYGLWKREWNERNGGKHDRGKSSGIERWNERPPQELPGVSPAVVRFLLPLCIFGRVQDLGYSLPPLYDRVETIKMGKELGTHYNFINDFILEKAMKLLKDEKDPGLVSVWFATVRYRPMSAWRDEEATYQGETILPMPALPICLDARGHLPKEERLAERVRENRAKGRKTLIFTEQTGTRDIRPRLVSVLREAIPEVNVQTLASSDMKPLKREAWIKRNMQTMDALIVNPVLVETGLDLIGFSDVIFFETNTSLYTVWQSMRRVWRLGQKNYVTTTFLAYADTAEEGILQLMGQKMKHGMLLYGDDAAGALIESDEEDVARAMIKRAMSGMTIENVGEINGKSLFGTTDDQTIAVSTSPLGSAVAMSAPLPMVEAEAEPERSPVQPAIEVKVEQLALFGDMIAIVNHSRRRR